MTKSKIITLLIAIAVIVALLIVAGVTGGAEGRVDCPDCEGITSIACETCGGEGDVNLNARLFYRPFVGIREEVA